MNALDFFIKKADSIRVGCYGSGCVDIEIDMERDDRTICISRDKGLVELSCLVYLGGGDEGSASILDDELKALIEFIPAFKSGQDQISQISSLLLETENDSLNMSISESAVEIKCRKNGDWDPQYSCSISRNQELQFEGPVPMKLKEKMQRVAQLIWAEK